MATLLTNKDQFLQKGLEAIIQRTPTNIRNEQGFDLTPGSPIRAQIEAYAIISANSQETIEAETREKARDVLFTLAGVDTIPESKATGVLSITSAQSITIPAGEAVYSLETGNKVAEVIEEVVFTDIETKDVRIIADEAGQDVVFVAGDLFLTVGFQTGTNLTIIDNGIDEESNYDKSLRVSSALKAKETGTASALIETAKSVVLTDINGIVIESVISVYYSTPWKHDPEIDPDRYGEIVLSIQSSLGIPSQELLDEIQIALTGNTEIDGRQGAGQNVVLKPTETEDVYFTVPYKRTENGVHATIVTAVQTAITSYVNELLQGEPINPTNWQARLVGIEGVEYFDEQNLYPAVLLTIDPFKIWNITLIDVYEI